VTFKLVSVVVPCHNEGPSIVELFSRLKATFVKIDQPFEVILVDDGSADNTAELAQELRNKNNNFSIVRHFRQHGKSMALMSGFAVARGEVIVTMDGDLQDLPEMIPLLLKPLTEGFDLVNSWRRQRQDPFVKRMVSKIFNSLIYSLDCACNIKLLLRNIHSDLWKS